MMNKTNKDHENKVYKLYKMSRVSLIKFLPIMIYDYSSSRENNIKHSIKYGTSTWFEQLLDPGENRLLGIFPRKRKKNFLRRELKRNGRRKHGARSVMGTKGEKNSP